MNWFERKKIYKVSYFWLDILLLVSAAKDGDLDVIKELSEQEGKNIFFGEKNYFEFLVIILKLLIFLNYTQVLQESSWQAWNSLAILIINNWAIDTYERTSSFIASIHSK